MCFFWLPPPCCCRPRRRQKKRIPPQLFIAALLVLLADQYPLLIRHLSYADPRPPACESAGLNFRRAPVRCSPGRYTRFIASPCLAATPPHLAPRQIKPAAVSGPAP